MGVVWKFHFFLGQVSLSVGESYKAAVLCDNPHNTNQLHLFTCLATIHQWHRHTITRTNNSQDKLDHDYHDQLEITLESVSMVWYCRV